MCSPTLQTLQDPILLLPSSLLSRDHEESRLQGELQGEQPAGAGNHIPSEVKA
jgi:hypothetical protein